MNKSLRFLFFAMLVAVAGVRADHMVYADDCCDEHVSPFFIRIEGGYSASSKTSIKFDDKNDCRSDCNGNVTTAGSTDFWPVDNLADTTSDSCNTSCNTGLRHNLDQAGMVAVEFGYNWNCWFGTGFSAAHRGNYRFDTCYRVNGTVGDLDIPEALRDQRLLFDIDNTFYAVNFNFNRTGWNTAWAWRFGCDCNMQIAPYLNVGLGWSRNTMFDFNVKLVGENAQVTTEQTQLNVTDEAAYNGTVPGGSNLNTNPLAAVLPYKVNNAFGWQIGVGFDLMRNECVSLGLGYRYFNGGRIKTADHTTHRVRSSRVADAEVFEEQFPVMVPKLKANLRANEFVASFSFYF